MDEFSVYEPNNEEMELPPGFRFHPTDEELITHYLSPKALQSSFCAKAIGEVDLNKVEPWDLPSIAKMGESEFYFFCLRDRKYPTGSRTNRATNAGFWKATGKDKEIYRCKNLIGMKKTLVFYQGRAPKGEKTNWVMHEYRSEGEYYSLSKPKNEWVISRVFCKSSGGKKTHISNLEPRTDCENVLQNLSLPPLMEYSGCYDQTSTMAVDPMSYSSYPTNEKKPREEMVDNSNDSLLFTESSFSDLIIPTQFTPNNQMVKDQSMMRYLVQNGRDLKTEFSVKSETKTDFGSVSSGLETGQGMDIDDINILRGPVDLDCLWDY